MAIKLQADYTRAFKEADIRGVYPEEIDEELTYFIARAFVEEYSYREIIVGRDMRLSSPVLYDSFCKGATDSGARVIDIGLVSSPMMYFAAGSLNLPGVIITASHSPKNYNGLKLVFPGAIPLTEAGGLRAIRKRIEKGVFKNAKKPGVVRKKDIQKGYQRLVCEGLRRKDYEALSIVADCGNGMAGVVLPLLKEKLPIDFFTLFPELDGNFPNRDSDPTLKKNQRIITKLLKAGGHDFGVPFLMKLVLM
jgi:phosphomannomutase